MTPSDERVENRKARIMSAAAQIYCSVRANTVGTTIPEAISCAIEFDWRLNQALTNEAKSGS
jgi:hypothetical protein